MSRAPRLRRGDGDPSEVSDETLIAGMASGDEQAAIIFVRRFQRRCYGLAYSLIGEASIAEDVAEEALARVWRHAPVFDPRRGSVTTRRRLRSAARMRLFAVPSGIDSRSATSCAVSP